MWEAATQAPGSEGDTETYPGHGGPKKRRMPASFATGCKDGAEAPVKQRLEQQVPAFQFKVGTHDSAYLLLAKKQVEPTTWP
jgi:hypothetical protein